MNLINPFINNSTPVYNEVTDLQSVFNETEVANYMKARYGGSYYGGTPVVLNDVDYATDVLRNLAYNATARNECGFEVKRISYFDLGQPASGDANQLLSERLMITQTDGTVREYIHFTNSNKYKRWNAITGEYLGELDVASLTSDERQMVHPHLTLPRTVFYQKGSSIYTKSLTTGTETLLVNLGFTPALPWANGDGNTPSENGRMLISEAAGVNQVWALDTNTGEAVTSPLTGSAGTYTRTYTNVPIASRVTLNLPVPGGSSLDYAFLSSSGKYIIAIIKSSAGPDGGSGCYIYDLSGNYIGKLFGGTGHYSKGWSNFDGIRRECVIVKVAPGQSGLYPGILSGDQIAITFEVSVDAVTGAYALSLNGYNTLDWVYSNTVPSGGQHSQHYLAEDVAIISMKAAYTNTTEIEANYITEDFFGKEEIFELSTSIPNAFRRIGKNRVRRNSPVNDQTEVSLFTYDSLGNLYIVFMTGMGPIEGSSTNLLTNKDIFMVKLPPRASQSQIQYYLSL